MWMGIDIGTGASRALLVDCARAECARGYGAAHEDIADGAAAVGRAAPRELVGRCRRRRSAARSMQAEVSGADVQGVGLSGQMHGLVHARCRGFT